jgi:catecholate siderophore receptor
MYFRLSRRSTDAARAPLSRQLLSGTALTAVVGCVLALPASAQSASGSTADTLMELPTLTVEGESTSDYKSDRSSSEKFTAPLLDTPKTVTVIPAEVFEARDATSLEEVLRTTPGITLGAGEGGVPSADLPNIRGFGAESNIYVDGIRDPGSQTRDMFNLEQVEVIKGPGSAYSGRGSTGGSIDLVTKKPGAKTFYAGSGSVGAPLRGRATADSNIVLSDTVAIRLNAMAESTEVAGRDEVETSSLGFAPSLTLGLGEPTRATFSFYHLQTDDTPDYGIPYDPRTGRPADVDRDNFYGLLNRDFQKTQVDTGTIEVEHDIDDRFTLRNVTRYSWSENDYIVTNPDDSAGNVVNGTVWRAVKSRNADSQFFTNQTDLSGAFETGSLGHSFNTGFEVSRQESRNRGYTVDTGNRNCATTGIGAASSFNCTSLFAPDPNAPWVGAIGPSSSSSATTVNTRAVYAFDTIEITPQWLVNLGVRFDDYETEAESSGGRGGPFNGTNRSSFINYQGGIVYKPLPWSSVYVSYGTSSDPSGTTAGEGRDNIGSSDVDLDPEESVSYEIGTKWNVMDDQLSLTAALFRTDKTNARVSDPAGGTSEVLSGRQRVQGFELGMAGNITEQWRVFGGYTYMESEIIDDGAGTNDGNEMPNVPKQSLAVWSTYDVLPDWTLGGGATFMAHRYGDTGNTKEVPAYWRFDAMVEYRVTDDVDVRLNVNNLLDERYFDKPYTTHFATVAPGRSAVVTTSFKF